ncbi:hypothetical protein [Clavibacter sp. Sh2126]|uniref:hypothetical protein n=1 Tax=Clavibacter sp. Sh2126 TaxID=3397678 RepID=UPI0039DF898B
MKRSPARSRLLAGGLAALAVVSAALTLGGPAPAAQAESNFRVCGVFNSARYGEEIGTGMITKVYKYGSSTCDSKMNFMAQRYGQVYGGSYPYENFHMINCEDFGSRSGTGADPCYQLDQNIIYTYTSPNDRVHPNPPSFRFYNR